MDSTRLDSSHRIQDTLQEWSTILGSSPEVGDEMTGRELWPVAATDGAEYYLKRLGPWRNLPLADECRVQRWLARRGIPVAEYLLTDAATMCAGELEDSFVLMPRLPSDAVTRTEALAFEGPIGHAVAALHQALADYPWPANSYTEQLGASLRGDLCLPADLTAAVDERRGGIAGAVDRLPLQLVHGDLTPENVLVRRSHGVTGFIDLDHLPHAPRAWDLARYLSRRLRRRGRQDMVTDGHRLAHVTPFLRGYLHQFPLTPEENCALPGLVLAANVIEASYARMIAIGKLDRRQLPDHLETLEDTEDAVRWHLEHEHDVVSAVRAATV